MCRVGYRAEAGDSLGENDDAYAHGELLKHRGHADAGDISDTFEIGPYAALGELETDILALFADRHDGHYTCDRLAEDRSQGSAGHLHAGEAELAVNKQIVEDYVDDIGRRVVDHGRFRVAGTAQGVGYGRRDRDGEHADHLYLEILCTCDQDLLFGSAHKGDQLA